MKKLILLTATLALLGAGCVGGQRTKKETIRYGDEMSSENIKNAREDCARRRGTFVECGSACEPGVVCTAQCVLTCEF